MKNWVYFQMCDAIKCQIMSFKPIFSPVEDVLYVWWAIYPLYLKNVLKWLKIAFVLF